VVYRGLPHPATSFSRGVSTRIRVPDSSTTSSWVMVLELRLRTWLRAQGCASTRVFIAMAVAVARVRARARV